MLIWMIRLASVVALAGWCGAIWFAGPMLGFGDTRPLESAVFRASIIGGSFALLAVLYGLRLVLRRRAQQSLERAVIEADDAGTDASILKTRMSEAIATLKRTARNRNFLYDLPWYIVIGPPGAGKTTALVNSGLRFPLAGSGEAQPVSGVGGTRYCDWWFTDDAVIIDTAGRYTTQDSDSDADKKSWLAFLALLKQNRPHQPINGVILAIGLADLMTSTDQARAAHAIEIANRLRELQEQFRTDFPVYLLFTKADLVVGFTEYFGDLDEEQRRQVWGATFQIEKRGENLSGKTPEEFDGLAKRLAAEMPDRLQIERDAVTRINLFGFPRQFEALRPKIIDLISRIFQSSRNEAATLRGFYFSSGTQEGTPIDQVIGAIGRSFGGNATPHLSGSGKSFFLHDLLTKVAFAESGWVSRNERAEHRAKVAKVASMATIAVIAAGTVGVLGLSFLNNRNLIDATRQMLSGAHAADDLLAAGTVGDIDLENVIDPLDVLRTLPVGYEHRDLAVPMLETFGLTQRPRLVSAATTAYGTALERLFRSRLLLQLERTIADQIASPAALYEPLKVYLTLGGRAPKIDTEMVVAWFREDWASNRYPGEQNRAGREELEKHLRAMLALSSDRNPSFPLNQTLVETAQRSIGRMTVADRATALIESAAASAGMRDFAVIEQAGPEGALIFDTTDGSDVGRLRIPALYTRAGFQEFYLRQLASVAQRVSDDAWVLGQGGQLGGVDQELLRLGPEMLDRYGKSFVGAWNTVLDRLRFKPLAADKPQYLMLSAAASPNSPIRTLFEAIASETTLTGEAEAPDEQLRQGLNLIGINLPSGKSQSRAGAAFANAREIVPGASIEAQFRSYQVLASGPPGRRPIDALIRNLGDIHESLTMAAAVAQTERTGANLQLQISNLRANASRLPKALSRMVLAAADEFEGDAAEASIAELNRILADSVAQPCEDALAGRYPFNSSSSADVPMEDFARVFAPDGILDRFFAQNLSPLVSMSGQNWDWKQDTQIGRKLSNATLRKFQLAAEIRDAFFPMGGSIPAINITLTPFSLNAEADQALLDVNGQIVQSYQAGSSAATVTWPGSLASGSTALSLTPELPGRESSIRFDGAWSLKRLFNTATFKKKDDAIEARFVIGGRDIAYTVQFNSVSNPFTLPALAEFTCPTSL
ncbi:MAG: type VI secretion system membrane subunit TssM [Rhizobiaceae bacterium]